MTRDEWLTSADTQAMLRWLTGSALSAKVSDRKLRLFACACCRQVWHLLTDPRSRNAVEVVERYADGQVTDEELAAARDAAWAVAGAAARAAAGAAAGDAGDAARAAAWAAAGAAARAEQAALLRGIVGDPFEPVKVSPPVFIPHIRAWNFSSAEPFLNEQVLSLAQAVYEDRIDDGTLDPARLAVLSDALEEAGCPAEVEVIKGRKGAWADSVPHPLLAHLRSPGPHYRGMWSLDLVLGKE